MNMVPWNKQPIFQFNRALAAAHGFEIKRAMRGEAVSFQCLILELNSTNHANYSNYTIVSASLFTYVFQLIFCATVLPFGNIYLYRNDMRMPL